MKNNIKIIAILALFSLCFGCNPSGEKSDQAKDTAASPETAATPSPDVEPVARVSNAIILKIDEDVNDGCTPRPGCVVACESGLARYKIFYDLTNISMNAIGVSNPQVAKKSGSLISTNNCHNVSNQNYNVLSGQTIALADSLCFPSGYVFQPNTDSIVFSVNVQGNMDPILIPLPICN